MTTEQMLQNLRVMAQNTAPTPAPKIVKPQNKK